MRQGVLGRGHGMLASQCSSLPRDHPRFLGGTSCYAIILGPASRGVLEYTLCVSTLQSTQVEKARSRSLQVSWRFPWQWWCFRDVDVGVAGVGGTWASYWNIKHGSVMLEPGVVVRKRPWNRWSIHLAGAAVVTTKTLHEGQCVFDGVDCITPLEGFIQRHLENGLVCVVLHPPLYTVQRLVRAQIGTPPLSSMYPLSRFSCHCRLAPGPLRCGEGTFPLGTVCAVLRWGKSF